MTVEITGFDWVPDFAKGFVRDLRPRWACEEIGLDYAEHLISAINRPADHFLFQPWGQVPVLNDGGVRLFESGAMMLHLAGDLGLADGGLADHHPTGCWTRQRTARIVVMIVVMRRPCLAQGQKGKHCARPSRLSQQRNRRGIDASPCSKPILRPSPHRLQLR